ncbi:MAG: hypothetical protein IJB70_08125 [Clostridia bacterium]|nr:hypothetical protein [Clostridia bacterium]
MKKSLSIILVLLLMFVSLNTVSYADDSASLDITTTSYRYYVSNDEEKIDNLADLTGIKGASLDKQLSFIIIKSHLPGRSEIPEDKMFESYKLRITVSSLEGGSYNPDGETCELIHKVSNETMASVTGYYSGSEQIFGYTKEDGEEKRTLKTNLDTVISASKVSVEEFTAVDEPNTRVLWVELKDYANELLTGPSYDPENGIDMNIAFAVYGYTSNVRVTGSSVASRPVVRASLTARDVLSAAPVKIIAPKGDAITDTSINNANAYTLTLADSITTKAKLKDNVQVTSKRARLGYFEVPIPAGMTNKENTLDSCKVTFVTNYDIKSFLYFYVKQAGDNVDLADYNSAKVPVLAQEFSNLSIPYTQEAITISDVAHYLVTLDLTTDAKAFIESADYDNENGSVMYALYMTKDTSSSRIRTGSDLDGNDCTPKYELTVTTDAVIDYSTETSLTKLSAGSNIIAITTASNTYENDNGALLFIAQYKKDGNALRLISVSTLDAKPVVPGATDELIQTETVQVNADADVVKAFVWGQSQNTPYAECAEAMVISD